MVQLASGEIDERTIRRISVGSSPECQALAVWYSDMLVPQINETSITFQTHYGIDSQFTLDLKGKLVGVTVTCEERTNTEYIKWKRLKDHR